MRNRSVIGLAMFAAAVLFTCGSDARAFDDAQYPNIRGGWYRPGAAQWDPTKPAGLRQEAPLTLEYQAVFEANLKETARGGQSYNPQTWCFPAGMPRLMIAYDHLEFIILPEVTYIRSDHLTEFRRIYTDGRDWPEKAKPTFEGTSIGKWIDVDGDGRFDVLEVETRGMKGPRVLDASGIPLHKDNATIVKERIFLDPANPEILHDQVTTIDHALTRPWTVTRSYRREHDPLWLENNCSEANRYLILRGETYYMTNDRVLLPTRKEQPPPDLKYFGPSK
jgi:hypothetical protein